MATSGAAKGRTPRAGAWIETLLCPALKRRGRLSLPVRERGSKPFCRVASGSTTSSLPARERGSKQREDDARICRQGVAPRAGAWIETVIQLDVISPIVVAPRAGAWIETRFGSPGPCSRDGRSTPRAGAWIETTSEILPRKRRSGTVAPRAGAWDRNSPLGGNRRSGRAVAPRAGAWIETGLLPAKPQRCAMTGRSPCGSVDRNSDDVLSDFPW